MTTDRRDSNVGVVSSLVNFLSFSKIFSKFESPGKVLIHSASKLKKIDHKEGQNGKDRFNHS